MKALLRELEELPCGGTCVGDRPQAEGAAGNPRTIWVGPRMGSLPTFAQRKCQGDCHVPHPRTAMKDNCGHRKFFSEEQGTQGLGSLTRECHDRREATVTVVTGPTRKSRACPP